MPNNHVELSNDVVHALNPTLGKFYAGAIQIERGWLPGLAASAQIRNRWLNCGVHGGANSLIGLFN
ncbi:hypothetical protein BDDG_12876 [Blastomyces dermatitidis ATCC 18188]|uniref:Uncharacterized protein n=1 Tax=Ajellomyces dermatitidis (strain ATCC 18188 / CBS 674.68) TaxID=653446 RepID=A0A0J9EQG4_AJEDA|nr:hypothetical protein BDDG_12876 [Blastomyces dermatitidis ATCC 18188]